MMRLAAALLFGCVFLSPHAAAEEKDMRPRFTNVRMQEQVGARTASREVNIILDTDRLLVAQPRGGKGVLRDIPYDQITAVQFEGSPRDTSMSAVMFVSPVFAFTNGTNRFLTVKFGADYVLLKLPQSNYKLVLTELDRRMALAKRPPATP